MLLQDDQHSSEIDHVLISKHGVFVIETKSHPQIFVRSDGRWFSGDGPKAHEIGNPVVQNRGHIKALKAVLGKDVPCTSLVVLARNNPEIHGEVPAGVLPLKKLRETIESFHTVGEARLDPGQIQGLADTLDRLRKTDRDSIKEHVRRAQAKRATSGIQFD